MHVLSAVFISLGVCLGRTSAESLAVKQRSFSDQLIPLLHQMDDSNDCTSSLGVSMMFDLIAPGASGDSTALQMCNILGFPCELSGEGLAWDETAERITNDYNGQCLSYETDDSCEMKVPTLEIANSIWIDNSEVLLNDYMEKVGGFIQRTDFSDDGAGKVVNNWVQNSTNGLIDSIIEEGRIEYDLLAINSIYLNATWEKPFREKFTNEDNFYGSLSRDTSSAVTPAHFMHMVNYFPYSDTALPGYQVVQLPFARSQMSMIIFLPQTEDSLSTPVTHSDVLAIVPDLTLEGIALALPKFSFASEYEDELKVALRSLGLTAPFDIGYCGIFGDSCARLEFIKQKTFINVYEKGTEAAAVTVGGIKRSVEVPPSTAISFIADHAFQFFIYIDDEELVVFEGRVGSASIPEGSEPAQLQSEHTHTDSDFWTVNFGLKPVEPNIAEVVAPTTTLAPPTTTLAAPSTTSESTMSLSSTTPIPQPPGTIETTALPPITNPKDVLTSPQPLNTDTAAVGTTPTQPFEESSSSTAGTVPTHQPTAMPSSGSCLMNVDALAHTCLLITVAFAGLR